MTLASVFEIFKIGIGPSSSHTVGPMLAANHYISSFSEEKLKKVSSIHARLYGSLCLTGKGHGTDRAVICGLEGFLPDSVDSDLFINSYERIKKQGYINIAGKHQVKTSPEELLGFHPNNLPLHPNGMQIEIVFDDGSKENATYYSTGGGFVSDGNGNQLSILKTFSDKLPFPFESAKRLLEICISENKSIAEIMLENEKSIYSLSEINDGINRIWQIMNDCIETGCRTTGTLPGGLNVSRRASAMKSRLDASQNKNILSEMDYLSCYALAVNEENASFGRIVTAPTNGAAGVVPAVFKFYVNHLKGSVEKIQEYLLTATAIANLFKHGASLSAAEMGCQGEIGVASSMAAAALTAIQGGSASQVENAAEIAIEHSLGLTCDPIGGLVQIPCIERNAIGAAKAVAASQLALSSDGKHIVSLDQAIAAMKKTGIDMHSKYKETSTGGLAISVAAPEC